jgi:hypothetical protein
MLFIGSRDVHWSIETLCILYATKHTSHSNHSSSISPSEIELSPLLNSASDYSDGRRYSFGRILYGILWSESGHKDPNRHNYSQTLWAANSSHTFTNKYTRRFVVLLQTVSSAILWTPQIPQRAVFIHTRPPQWWPVLSLRGVYPIAACALNENGNTQTHYNLIYVHMTRNFPSSLISWGSSLPPSYHGAVLFISIERSLFISIERCYFIILYYPHFLLAVPLGVTTFEEGCTYESTYQPPDAINRIRTLTHSIHPHTPHWRPFH